MTYNMMDFFPIETPYNSKDYEIMKTAVNKGIDSHLQGFIESEFKKSPSYADKFLWNIHKSELPILFRRLNELYEETGDYDYKDFEQEIRDHTTITEPQEVDEIVNPYDPMDANQTLDGQPAGNSNLHNSKEWDVSEIAEMIKREFKESLGTQGLSYDNEDQMSKFERENGITNEGDSDSLRNAHGENIKPQNLKESGEKRYEEIMFAQGNEAIPIMDILYNDGEEAALNHLRQWHFAGQHKMSDIPGHGELDKTFSQDGFTMSWNPYIPYIGLTYDTQHDLDEDSQLMRHQANQRGKIGNVPLGQHAPHSQTTISEKDETDSVEIPRNKPLINGKFRRPDAIKIAIQKVMTHAGIEGKYNDENWTGVLKLQEVLKDNDISFHQVDTPKYSGEGEAKGSNLPTRKIYNFELNVRNKDGKSIPLFLKVICTFIGKTGTMADSQYELTYHFA